MLISFFAAAWVWVWAWALAGVALAVEEKLMIVMEKVAILPEGWKLVDEAPDLSTPIRISFALSQPNIDDHIAAVVLWDKTLRREDAQLIRRPNPYNTQFITKWLSKHGVTLTEQDEDWLHVTTTVGTVNELLRTKLGRYSFRGRKPVLRTMEYSIPAGLQMCVDFIHPIANFMTPAHEVMSTPQYPPPQQQQQSSRKRQNVACSPFTTPDCIHKLYGINYVTPDGKSPVRLGVAGFLEQWANYADTRQNFAESRPDLDQAGYNFTVELINGGENRQDAGQAGIEANLDIQYAMAVGFPTNVVYYSTRGRGEKLGDKLDDSGKRLPEEVSDNEPYLEFFLHIAKKADAELPHVISMSYADDEFTVPRLYAKRVCNEIAMLTLRGVSILAGSGDGGAMGSRNASCRAHDGRNKADMTISTFPSSCPWVTSVGAVQNGVEPPEGAEFSAGGFSDVFPRPHWQRESVHEYVKALDGHLKGYYNPKGRATPDISVVGTMFHTIVNGQPMLLQGTSASTPVLAAMIALINDARIRKKKAPIVHLSKRLYSKKVRKVLQDITTGQSLSCSFPNGQRPGGWPAAQGWDAMTGLGVPNNFEAFMHALMHD
ncbi:hypothetical protein E4U53_002114 [Claviceps sorghi]|nr:hypothetical protein E4U53_002114 [Claviceps sorghi]